jgi:hypothetical protein
MYRNYKEIRKYNKNIRKIGEKRKEHKEEEGNVEENWKRIEKVIKEAADETLDKEINQGNKAWFDEECMKAVSEKNNTKKRMLQGETRKNYGRYRELRREANRVCKRKKKENMKR